MKGFGLKATKNKARAPLRAAVFSAEEDDEEEEEERNYVGAGHEKKNKGSSIAQVNRSLLIGKAASIADTGTSIGVVDTTVVDVDASIFDYDGAMDRRDKIVAEQQQASSSSSSSGVNPAAPMYIQNLLKTAQLRDKEREIITEKKILNARKIEDAQYGDLPSYVTSAYKAKLQADEKFVLENDKRDEQVSGKDVHNVGMAGFYGARAGTGTGTGSKGVTPKWGSTKTTVLPVSMLVDPITTVVSVPVPVSIPVPVSGVAPVHEPVSIPVPISGAASSVSEITSWNVSEAPKQPRKSRFADNNDSDNVHVHVHVNDQIKVQGNANAQAQADDERNMRMIEVHAARERYFARRAAAQSGSGSVAVSLAIK
jgi:hypothetical protein